MRSGSLSDLFDVTIECQVEPRRLSSGRGDVHGAKGLDGVTRCASTAGDEVLARFGLSRLRRPRVDAADPIGTWHRQRDRLADAENPHLPAQPSDSRPFSESDYLQCVIFAPRQFTVAGAKCATAKFLRNHDTPEFHG